MSSGNSHVVTLPSELERTDFPYDLGDEVTVELVEDRKTGDAHLRVYPVGE